MLTESTIGSAGNAQRLGPSKDVSFFRVGRLKVSKQERTTIIYMTNPSKVSDSLSSGRNVMWLNSPSLVGNEQPSDPGAHSDETTVPDFPKLPIQ